MTSFRRPSAATAIAGAIAVAILLGLGFWQLERRDWKRDLIAEIEAVESTAPLSIGSLATLEDQPPFTPVTLTGRWVDEARHVLNRTLDGAVGVHEVAPLALADATVMVDLGWRPIEADWSGPPVTADPVRVTGRVRPVVPPGWFAPVDDPAAATWFQVSPATMAPDADPPVARDLWIQASAHGLTGPTAPIPRGGAGGISLPNNHLQYALTWFSLALVLIVVFAVYHRRPR